MDDPKLTVFPGGGSPDKMAEAVRQLEANLPVFAKHQKLVAVVLWAKYNGLIDAGFTPAQALEIVKAGV